MRIALLLSVVALAACNTLQQPRQMVARPTTNWRDVVTPTDRERLREWRSTFVRALQAAQRAGHRSEITRGGALLVPDASLGGGIPNGSYRCRIIKLGAKSEGLLDYVEYPAFVCRIEPRNGVQHFTKLSGSQRQVGLIFPGDAMRQVFLGTLALGDERGAMQYGQDETRNVAGYVERVTPNRWRLIMPQPHFESQMDVMELIPMGGQ